jgi:DNA-binding NarL/FixJ family response regulator
MAEMSRKNAANSEKGAARPGRSNGAGRALEPVAKVREPAARGRDPVGKAAPRADPAKPARSRDVVGTPRARTSPGRAVRPGAATKGPGKVVVVDPLPLFRAGAVAALTAGGVPVVGEAMQLDKGIELVRAERAGVLLLGGASVEEVTIAVRAVPSCAVVVLLSQPSRAELVELLGTGIAGFALRSLTADELVATVAAAAQGRAATDGRAAEPVFVPLMVGLAQPDAPPDTNGGSFLTLKEREILAQLARGGSNKEIAEALFVTPATVKTHLAHIYAKLGARSRHEALTQAFAMGILH